MEFNFQKIVLIVAICLLIVVLTGMSYLMKKSISERTWPPTVSACPDYWTETILDVGGSPAGAIVGDKICNAGINKYNAGTNNSVIQINTSTFPNTKLGKCNRYKWTQTGGSGAGVIWDGVSNVPSPC